MNQQWKDFLLAEQALFEDEQHIVFPVGLPENDKHIYPLTHLAVLSVTGKDAANLLQGQVTCNVNEVSERKAIFGAMCNPKGRVISTFLLLKSTEGFLLVLPHALLGPVKKKLQMYVLRSVVTLTDCSDTLCLIGLSTSEQPLAKQFDVQGQDSISVQFSALENRQLVIAQTDKAVILWSDYSVNQGFNAANTAAWQTLDIMSGIPWLSEDTSEEYIPQMLNVDKLGGVSFNKGCYTGQEIVARTHYLGKTKRALFIAECDSVHLPAGNAAVFDENPDNTQAVGSVLSAQHSHNKCKMLVVLSVSETDMPKLTLADQTPLTLLAWPT
ncbi:YgfZ/GcvT domain-containing protein [Crenothrix sp.]|uniref:CAF17-like 4Fe-4S cluster assembly/insertion protein YgfZ n=1 Tax=Crenothrix sp. TaxID=3100433 RepID=UPI00374DB465